MPRKGEKKWTEEAMMQAYTEVMEGRRSLRQAAKEFGVPKSSLHERVSGKSTAGSGPGRKQLLSPEDENTLVEYCVYASRHGLPLTRPQLQASALKLYNHHHPAHLKTTMSRTWWYKFRARHQQRLTMKIPDNIDRGRSVYAERGPIEEYFALLDATIQEHGLGEKPCQIFNCDEMVFKLDSNKRKVVRPQGTKHAHKQPQGTREHITVLACFNAAGEDVPPFIIYKGGYPGGPYNKEGVPHALYAKSPSGYIDTELFQKWFVEHFLKHAPQERPLLLVLDDHQSHLDVELVQAAQREGVILLCLPPHTSHILLPLDVSFRGPLKTDFSGTVGDLSAIGHSLISKKKFSSVLRDSYQRLKDQRVVVAGFRKSGLYPLDSAAIDWSRVLPSDPQRGTPPASPCATTVTIPSPPRCRRLGAASASSEPSIAGSSAPSLCSRGRQLPDSTASTQAENHTRKIPIIKSLLKRKGEKKYRKWTKVAMMQAYTDVVEGKCTVRQAALVFGVPKSSLYGRVSGRVATGSYKLYNHHQPASLKTAMSRTMKIPDNNLDNTEEDGVTQAENHTIKMPSSNYLSKRKDEKKNRKWTEEAMMQAYTEVVEGRHSLRRAAQVFGVPRSSLYDRVCGNVVPGSTIGRKQLLSPEDENALVEDCVYASRHGLPLTRAQLQASALKLYNHHHPASPKTTMSRTWWYKFRARHHQRLTIRTPDDKLDKTKEVGVTQAKNHTRKMSSFKYLLKRKRDTKLRKWTKEAMMQAYTEVVERRHSLRQAAQMFGVPKSSLHDRISGKVAVGSNMGRKQLLSPEDKNAPLEDCVYASRRCLPLSRPQLQTSALKLYNHHHPTSPKTTMSRTMKIPDNRLDNTEEDGVTQAENHTRKMPSSKYLLKKKEEKKYRKWTKEAMMQAYTEVVEGRRSLRRAAQEFGVPRSSLHDRVRGKIAAGSDMGQKQLLSPEDENIDHGRSAYAERGPIEEYFALLTATIQEHGLGEKPCQIFNCMEMGFQLDSMRRKVTHKQPQGTREHITVLACFNAAGEDVPPFIIYKGGYPGGPYKQEGVPHALYAKSPSGYIDTELFQKWFDEHFLKHAPQERPLLLVLDGHQSHLEVELVQAAQREGVILLCLPLHTSHILQPLDVSFYGPLKTDFSGTVGDLSALSQSFLISKKKFSSVLRDSYQRLKDQRVVVAGFRKCGLYPLDSTAIDWSRVMPAGPQRGTPQASRRATAVTKPSLPSCRRLRAASASSEPSIASPSAPSLSSRGRRLRTSTRHLHLPSDHHPTTSHSPSSASNVPSTSRGLRRSRAASSPFQGHTAPKRRRLEKNNWQCGQS